MFQIEHAGVAERVATRRNGWWVTAALFLFMAVNFADKAVIGLVAVPMMHDMALSPAQLGVVGSSFFVLFALSGIAVGLIANRVNTTWLLAGLAFVWAIAQFPMMWPVSFGLLIACRVVLGAGEGPALPLALHVAYTCFEDRKRSVPTVIVQMGATAGIVLAGPVLTYIEQRWHWRATFFALGVAGLAWIVLWVAIRGASDDEALRRATQAEQTASAESSWRDKYRYIRHPMVLGVLLQSFVGYAVVAYGLVWMPVYFRLGLGYPAALAGWLFAFQVLGQVPVGLGLSTLSHQLLKRGVSTRIARGVLVSLSCIAGGALFCLVLTDISPLAKVVITGLASALGTQVFVFGPQLVSEVVPTNSRAAMLSLVHALSTTAGLAAPVLMGKLVSASSSAHSFEAGFCISGLLLVAAGLAGVVLLKPQNNAWQSR